MKKRNKFLKILAYSILLTGVISMIIPFLWMLLTSFMSNEQIFSYPPKFIPKPFIVENYSNVTTQMPIFKYFLNSLFVAIITTVGQIIIASLAGFTWRTICMFPCAAAYTAHYFALFASGIITRYFIGL